MSIRTKCFASVVIGSTAIVGYLFGEIDENIALNGDQRYGISENLSLSPSEQYLVDYTRTSMEQARNYQSKMSNDKALQADTRCMSRFGIVPFYHLLNNLCSMPQTSHLHIGIERGGSLVSALYGNDETLTDRVAIDIYNARSEMAVLARTLCDTYLPGISYTFLYQDCFKVDKTILKNKVNVYFYDAAHLQDDHKHAFTYYDDVLAAAFITVVDDWNWKQVQQGTFEAFKQLGYEILYEDTIPNGDNLGNGQYIAVIRRPEHS
jgi:hypothetical protein